jgi:hypothetical protein
MNDDKKFFRVGVYFALIMLIIGVTARLAQGHASESTGILIVGGGLLFLISSFGYIVNYNND